MRARLAAGALVALSFLGGCGGGKAVRTTEAICQEAQDLRWDLVEANRREDPVLIQQFSDRISKLDVQCAARQEAEFRARARGSR